jgi:hypothetical protein
MQASFSYTPLPPSSLSNASWSADVRAHHHYSGRAHIEVSPWPRARAPPASSYSCAPAPTSSCSGDWVGLEVGRGQGHRLVLPRVQEQATAPLHGEDESQLGRDSGLSGCAVKKQVLFHVAIKCSMCSRYSWRVLQEFQVDVAKVDLNVAMLHMLHTHVASV